MKCENDDRRAVSRRGEKATVNRLPHHIKKKMIDSQSSLHTYKSPPPTHWSFYILLGCNSNMSDQQPYVFQYATLHDSGRKRPLRRGTIVLAMPFNDTTLKIEVHADALASSSGIINSFYEEYAEENKECPDGATFPIPSFDLAALDEFLCEMYGMKYECMSMPDRGIKPLFDWVLLGVDVASYFDASKTHFQRLDAMLCNVLNTCERAPDHCDDIYFDILDRIETHARHLPISWRKALGIIVRFANDASINMVRSVPNGPSFPTEILLHPKFTGLSDSIQKKILFALVANSHAAWSVIASERKTCTHTRYVDTLNEMKYVFEPLSHDFVLEPSDGEHGSFFPNAHFYDYCSPIHSVVISGPKIYSSPVGRVTASIQLMISTRDQTDCIVIHVRNYGSHNLTFLLQPDILITYKDGSTERITSPGDRCNKLYKLTQGRTNIASVTGSVRVTYCA